MAHQLTSILKTTAKSMIPTSTGILICSLVTGWNPLSITVILGLAITDAFLLWEQAGTLSTDSPLA